jgi:hypothetical protein
MVKSPAAVSDAASFVLVNAAVCAASAVMLPAAPVLAVVYPPPEYKPKTALLIDDFGKPHASFWQKFYPTSSIKKLSTY